VDVDRIRSRFIQENLNRALEERDRERVEKAVRAFRSYFEWFGDRIPEPEKVAITSKLSLLERSCSSAAG